MVLAFAGDGGRAGRAPLGPARAPRGARARAERRRHRRAGARWPPRGRALAGARRRVVAALLPFVAGNYWLGVASEVLIFMLFAASLHFLVGAGGLVSFGHAAYFGLGSYGAALALKTLRPRHGARDRLRRRARRSPARSSFGWFCVRLTGVYFAMLTLAFAQIAWSVAFQWTDVTGGDNGLIGVWPSAWAAAPVAFLLADAGARERSAVAALRDRCCSRRSATPCALCATTRCARETIGIARRRVQWAAFAIAGGFAALAGALYRVPERQRVSRQSRHSLVDRRARDGAARRRRHGFRRRRRRRRVPRRCRSG